MIRPVMLRFLKNKLVHSHLYKQRKFKKVVAVRLQILFQTMNYTFRKVCDIVFLCSSMGKSESGVFQELDIPEDI